MSAAPKRLSSLSVLGGALRGAKVDVDVVDEVLIGSDPGCSFHLDLPGISPIHARLWVDLNGAVVHDTRSPTGVFVNFDRVEGQSPVREGDVIWLGPPQEPGSVQIQCGFVAGDADDYPGAGLPATDDMAEPALEETAPPGHAAPGPELADQLNLGEFVVEEPEPAPASPPEDAEFLVAGFDADWPQVAPAPPSSPTPPAAPVASRPAEASDDAFFIGEAAVAPPPAPTSGPADDPFFVEEDPGVAGPPPSLPSPAPEPDAVSFTADEFFFDAAPPAMPASVPIDLPPLVPPTPTPAAIPAPRPAPVPPPKPAPPVAPPVAKPAPPVAPPVARPAPVAAPPPVAARAAKPAAATAKPHTPAVARAAPGVARPAPTRQPEGPAGVRPTARRSSRPTAPAHRAGAAPLARYAPMGLAALAVLGGLAFVVTRFLGAAQVASIEPTRARTGQTVVLTGKGFASDPQANVVLFGDKPGTVVKATESQLEVVVPEVVTAPGQDVRVPVRVRAGRGESRPVELAVFAGPTLHGISPDVAMPGDEVVLAGAGWRLGAAVRFGVQAAEVLDVKETSIRTRVPPILGGPGTFAPVVVSVGGGESNPAPFYIGRVPLVLKVEPPAAAPGDLVVIRGRGFQRDVLRNAVLIGGARALIVAAVDDDLKVVVPRVPAGPEARPLQVRVAGSENVGQTTLQVPSPPEMADFRFVAEPFDAAYGKTHAVLATALGPAFVLAASGGRTAADRAVEAQRRLNEAVLVLSTGGLNFEVRTPDTTPALALAGRPELLLEVTEEDASAYNEDWTGLRGRGGAVSRTRLARWWEAVARDLVLMLVRNERPQFAAALAPEGRVLAEVFQAGQKAGGNGLPLQVLAAMKPATREALRLVAFRVPPTIPGPQGPASVAVAPAAAVGTPLHLEGTWGGIEIEEGLRRDVTATFKADSGSVAYEGMVTLTVPLLSLEAPQNNAVRFSLQYRGGIRYYNGRWDGQALAGTISRDPAGAETVATFTLRPR